MFPVAEELDSCKSGCSVDCDLSPQVFQVLLLVLVLCHGGASFEGGYCVHKEGDPGLSLTSGPACTVGNGQNLWQQCLNVGFDARGWCLRGSGDDDTSLLA